MTSNTVLQHAQKTASVAKTVAARRGLGLKAIAARFDRAVAKGELGPETDTEALARFHGAVVQGMSAQACDGASRATLKRVADIALSAWPGASGSAR
ncbi:hypothetical protein [Cupriavidus necator]|uniref:hypothetical protein n=1 Tax=Cupriavidus necator TaxID=106590 RepID=UPI00277E751D|nr:hypothetical protein [Cupriavidus necator]MDQ0141203.1 hypothetical protein [Cupriavidus necator]